MQYTNIIQLFSALVHYFFFKSFFFDHTKLKKNTLKVAQKHSNPLLFITALTAQTEEFMFQIVAYRPTVYRTGPETSVRNCACTYIDQFG